MGRGNSCVYGSCEVIYFIPYENFGEDEMSFDIFIEDFNENVKYEFSSIFKSFTIPKKRKWVDRDELLLCENRLFYLTVSDNEWSIAVKLLQKEGSDEYNYQNIEGLQSRHFKNYNKKLLKVLFENSNEVYGYNGAWTSKKLENEEKRK